MSGCFPEHIEQRTVCRHGGVEDEIESRKKSLFGDLNRGALPRALAG